MNPKEQMPSPVSRLEEDLAKTDFDEKTKNYIRENMYGLNRLYSDVVDIFVAPATYIQADKFESLKPLPQYDEYIKEGVFKDTPEVVEFILARSSQEAVNKLNNIIDRFNADLDRIKREKDAAAVEAFCREANNLVKWKEHDGGDEVS